MKSLIIKATILVVAAMSLTYYTRYLVTGKNPLKGVSLPSFPRFSLDTASSAGDAQTVYKWVDDKGVTQYASEPPPEYSEVKALRLDPETNIVQSTKVREKIELPQIEENAQPALPDGSIYNPETIKQVMDKAKNVQNLLDERTKKLEEASNDL